MRERDLADCFVSNRKCFGITIGYLLPDRFDKNFNFHVYIKKVFLNAYQSCQHKSLH